MKMPTGPERIALGIAGALVAGAVLLGVLGMGLGKPFLQSTAFWVFLLGLLVAFAYLSASYVTAKYNKHQGRRKGD